MVYLNKIKPYEHSVRTVGYVYERLIVESVDTCYGICFAIIRGANTENTAYTFSV